MKKNRIKKITLIGFRGVKEALKINLKDAQSLLVYGDNGTGKSTIADSIEWFLYNQISHLKGEEIPKNAGIRNIELNDQDISQVDIEFSNSILNSKKTLEIKNNKLTSTHSNTEESFKSYLNQSHMENLMIRNDELIRFIISTKSQRLADISDLIGYSEVTKVKNVLKKSVNDLKRIIKVRNFESQIASKQADLFREINANINNEQQFFSRIDYMTKELKIDIDIDSWESFKKLEKELSTAKPDPKLQLKSEVIKELSNMKAKEVVFNQLLRNLSEFQNCFKKLFEDKEKLKGIKIKSLLESAEHIIKSRVFDEKDKCPLCLQNISSKELLNSIQSRLEELQTLEEEIESLNQNKNIISETIRDIGELLGRVVKLECIKESGFNNLKKYLDNSLNGLRALYKTFSSESGFNIKEYYDEHIEKVKLISLEKIKEPLEEFKDSIKESNNSRITFATKINSAKSHFMDIQNLKNEQSSIMSQVRTMSQVYKSFLGYQKKEIELFLSSISDEMNRLFNLMNPGDNIQDIELIPISNNEEDFIGISYNLNFRNTSLQSPKMLLSESYLNCLGLCLFLSSVKSFNKENKFFILDDVISSFDKNHRQLFGRLLVEEFSDWQMLILTHEDEWFKYLSALVKSRNWIIKQMKWSNEIGSFIDEKALSLREDIEEQIQQSNVNGLGNKIGRYLEGLLKEICENLGAKMTFKRGEKNEKRQLEELLNSLLKRITEKQMGLENNPAITNLRNTQFFRNETSHDNTFNENLADMRVCFQDIINFANLFVCSETGEALYSTNASNGEIKTRSGYLSYNWK